MLNMEMNKNAWILQTFLKTRGGSRTAATTKRELFVIIVNGWTLLHQPHLGCCSSPRSTSENARDNELDKMMLEPFCNINVSNHRSLMEHCR